MEVENCDYEKLRVDEACVIFKNINNTFNLWLYSITSDCILCPYSKIAEIHNGDKVSLLFKSDKIHTWKIFHGDDSKDSKITNDTRNLFCELTPQLGQYGIYEVSIKDSGCEIDTIRQPTNPYTPVFVMFALLLFALLIISSCKIALNYWRKRKTTVLHNGENQEERANAKRRVQSIDTFRGMSILMMIFVNNGAGGYAVLEHATWDGLHIGDLVFPCFVWIMGVCVPIALTSQLSRGVSRFHICKNILRRSVLLFFIGVCLNTLGRGAQLEEIRIFGVLQRFGVAYFIIGIVYVLFSQRQAPKFENGCIGGAGDFLSLLPQWIIMLGILVAHCFITFCLIVPGCPKGYLGPGGKHKFGEYFNCTGGAAGYIDRVVLGVNHLYQHPTIDTVYSSGPFDPEGILGCMTTIFQAFLGVQAGKILRVHRDWKSRVIRWMIFSLIYGAIGAALHFKNIIPVNKNLWSVSFVLLTTSFALALLTACYLIMDVARVWNGGPFRIPGMNALVMYIGHQMCYQIFPFHWQYGAMNTHLWQTIAALWDVSLWTIIAYILHRKRIYISL